jgi:VirE N-terminal domain
MSDDISEKTSTTATNALQRLARTVSFFPNKTSKTPTQSKTAKEYLNEIRFGRWAKEVEAIRAAYRTGEISGDHLKGRLPAITWSGTFHKRNNDSLRTHSGFCCLDLDGLGDRLNAARDLLKHDRHVLALFVSPSERGLKVVVPVDAKDAETHRQCFLAAEAHLKTLGLTVDPTGKDVARLCFVSHDPDLWVSEGSCVPFSPASTHIILSALSAPSTRSAHSAPSAPLCTTVQGNLERRGEIHGELASNPYLARIYRQFIEGRAALPGKRNHFIVQMVPALYEVVAVPVVVRFSLTFYDLNRAMFNDGRAQHEAETRAMLENYRASYRAKLSAGEEAVYATLDGDGRGQAAFRVMRDLAKRGKENVFFLSCDELGARIDCDSRQAHRLLCAFNSDGLVEIVAPGVRRAHGAEARATEYKWKL